MQVIELRCPHCAAKLRLRDQSFVGRIVHCPDCTQPVSISRNAAGVVEAAPGTAATAHGEVGRAVPARSVGTAHPTVTGKSEGAAHPTVKPDGSGNAEAAVSPASSATRTKPQRLAPARIAWGVAGVLTVVIAATAWLSRPSPEPSAPAVADVREPAVAPDPAPATPPDPAPVPPPGELPPLNLQPLIDLLTADRDRRGRFPAEHPQSRPLPAEERLGWQAVLAAASDPAGPQPQWDRPVLDPLNARFVRRRLPVFLNPLLPETAVDGLPATHFVGVAGVGPEAAQLAISHPSAGIFGAGRETSPADVRDGLSNTLLILGAAGRPAPWAAGGDRTMRPLTQAPYVNGPDGFGTGQPDGMFVLLADGSTRFIAQDIDPVVLRRMAAMADGLPLNPNIRGEPGDTPAPVVPLAAAPIADPPTTVAATEPVGERPILPVVTPERVLPPPPSYDVERALSQPIVRFSQVRAVPFGDLLVQLEDLAGVPVKVEPSAAATLAHTVSLELDNTTVGAILRALAQRVGLQVETGAEFGVRLLPLTEKD